jgi:hypothetical protein
MSGNEVEELHIDRIDVVWIAMVDITALSVC